MGSKSDKISIRITPNQSLVLAEMSQALGGSYSMRIRTMLCDWITKNEEYLEKIIDKKSIQNATNQQTGEEAKA